MDETGTQIRRNIKRGINNDAYVQVVEGLEVVEKIQNCATARGDRPKEDITMTMELL